MMPLLLVLPVAAVVVVLLVALAQEEVLQEVLLRLELHRPGSAQARLHLHEDQHLDVPALLVDGLLDGVPGAQVVVALPVHCLGVLFPPIDIRRVLRYGQCDSVVSEGLCCIRGRSTLVQSLLVVRLSTGSLLHVCVHVGICLLASCTLCRWSSCGRRGCCCFDLTFIGLRPCRWIDVVVDVLGPSRGMPKLVYAVHHGVLERRCATACGGFSRRVVRICRPITRLMAQQT